MTSSLIDTSGFLVAAPASGSGKTTVTLGLIRHFRNAGTAVSSVKVGPDFIDPAFHRAASGRPCLNVDTWAMRSSTIGAVVSTAADGADMIIGEGAMGLFDGADDGSGSTASLAALMGWPVLLVVDAGGMAASAAVVVQGFARFQPDVTVGGVIFNKVGSSRHTYILEQACAPLGIPVLGALLHDPELVLPERHLGLVQADEHPKLEKFIERAATAIAEQVNVEGVRRLAAPASLSLPATSSLPPVPPLGQRIAVARDKAYAFSYASVIEGWRNMGATISFFSPLANEAPALDVDAVYLPGGYPELHAGTLAANDRFMGGLRAAANREAVIYGECGGFMTLGKGLVDADGSRHKMAGLLPVETSFAKRKLNLGYRQATLIEPGPLGTSGTQYRGHEFHYARLTDGGSADPLFSCANAAGTDLGPMGAKVGTVMGSYLHLIDRVD